jgi:hypothetical protein
MTMLNVSKSKLSRHLALGLVPEGFRIGASRRWIQDDITAWLEAGAPPAAEWAKRKAASRKANGGELRHHRLEFAPAVAVNAVPGREYQRLADRVAGGEQPSQVAVVYGVTPRGRGMEPPPVPRSPRRVAGVRLRPDF